MMTCSYKEAEFFRVGYYVSNGFMDNELQENPPAEFDYSKIFRHILTGSPRVTRFAIEWDQ